MDEREFDDFYAASFQRITGQVYAMIGNRDEAQECVQEAFARAWAHRKKIDKAEHPEAWVRTTAYRLAVSRWRRTTRGRRPTDRAVGAAVEAAPPSDPPRRPRGRPQAASRGAAAGAGAAPHRGPPGPRRRPRGRRPRRNHQGPAQPGPRGTRRTARRRRTRRPPGRSEPCLTRIDELENFSIPGPPMTPLPAAEVRRRGTRIRRRNNALADRRRPRRRRGHRHPVRACSPATRPSSAAARAPDRRSTWVQEIPADFDLGRPACRDGTRRRTPAAIELHPACGEHRVVHGRTRGRPTSTGVELRRAELRRAAGTARWRSTPTTTTPTAAFTTSCATRVADCPRRRQDGGTRQRGSRRRPPAADESFVYTNQVDGRRARVRPHRLSGRPGRQRALPRQRPLDRRWRPGRRADDRPTGGELGGGDRAAVRVLGDRLRSTSSPRTPPSSAASTIPDDFALDGRPADRGRRAEPRRTTSPTST